MYAEDATYDRALQERALRIIIERSADQASAAAHALQVDGDAARQMRLDRIIPQALRERDAFTEDERKVLASAISMTNPRD